MISSTNNYTTFSMLKSDYPEISYIYLDKYRFIDASIRELYQENVVGFIIYLESITDIRSYEIQPYSSNIKIRINNKDIHCITLHFTELSYAEAFLKNITRKENIQSILE